MTYFVFAYERRAARVLERLDRTERSAAMAARFELEDRYADSPDVEVVMLSALSEEALRRTHHRYFSEPLSLAPSAG